METVTLHYRLCLEDGTLVDRTDEDEPLQLVIGDGTLHPCLERCLMGLEAGASESFRLSPDEAFGPYDPDMMHPLDRDQFGGDDMLEPGSIIAFDTPGGDTLPGCVMAVETDHVDVDFNHPLAGRNIMFEVRVLACG